MAHDNVLQGQHCCSQFEPDIPAQGGHRNNLLYKAYACSGARLMIAVHLQAFLFLNRFLSLTKAQLLLVCGASAIVAGTAAHENMTGKLHLCRAV